MVSPLKPSAMQVSPSGMPITVAQRSDLLSRNPAAAGAGDAGARPFLVCAEHAKLDELIVQREAGADESRAGETQVVAKAG
jgi:hypothetical protein